MPLLYELLSPGVLVPWLLAMVFGIFVGSTPGLTATMAVAMLLPITFHMPSLAGMAMILGVSFTAIFAGDIPATFLRIPGTPASTAATLDGHVMAQQGKGGLAIALDLMCSAIGGIIGVLLLILIAPQLAEFALQFSYYERFWLAVLGLSLTAIVSLGSIWRGFVSAALGVLLSTVGFGIFATPRFTFGQDFLLDGIHFIPAMIGLFGLAEALRGVQATQQDSDRRATLRLRLPWVEAAGHIARKWWLVLQSSVAGTVIGALPGAGADVAAWGAYGLAERTSRRRGHYGRGEVEGVIAPTSANNAAVAGAWIPALVFGVPGDAVTAIVIGALMMHGISPGPDVFRIHAHEIHGIFAIAIVTQLLLLPAGWTGIHVFGLMLRLPRRVILSVVIVSSVVGAYALQLKAFDVVVMFAFGLLGLVMEAQRVPTVPLILGMILGPYLEENLRTGLIRSEGSWQPFVFDPQCAVLIGLLVLAFIMPLVRGVRRVLGV